LKYWLNSNKGWEDAAKKSCRASFLNQLKNIRFCLPSKEQSQQLKDGKLRTIYRLRLKITFEGELIYLNFQSQAPLKGLFFVTIIR